MVMLEVCGLKWQIGVWVDAQLWSAYKELCDRDSVRPADPIEAFVGFVVRSGSASAALSMFRVMDEAEAESFEAYARVLLEWYKSGKRWVYVTDENEAPVGFLLLEALKKVRDKALREEIEETLKAGK
ncbi:MAG: hypothetical protein N0A00_07070 [Candidatus Bathyarchaeota archaeon]|nr:hypothetical protein [Candidatus Bathyarchaeota archaeon]